MEGASIAAIISGVLTIIVMIAKAWERNRPGREESKRVQEIQQGRTDIVDNPDAVSTRVDKLCADTSGDPSGLGSAEDVERRLRAL